MKNVITKSLVIIIVLYFPIFCIGKSNLQPSKSNTLIVVGDKVNVRMSPIKNSKVIYQLDIATRVELLKRTDKIMNVGGNKGEWVYIDTFFLKKNSRETIKGWMFNYYLADKDKFKKMKSYKKCTIETMVGDALYSYEFNKNATYERRDIDINRKSVYIKGSLYRYKDVVIAHDEKILGTGVAKADLLLFMKKDGNLCSNILYDGDGNQVCTKCD